ncbi:MAG: SDR family NAD(P)-dependent oxidoreductase [Sphingopyxis sp.]
MANPPAPIPARTPASGAHGDGPARPFAGRVALVTGGTSGIGLAIARALSSAGARVLINSEDAAACATIAAQLGGVALPADLADGAAVDALADRAWDACGRIDHMFLNAGITGARRAGDAGYEDEVARLFAINLHHIRRTCDRILPRMAQNGGAAGGPVGGGYGRSVVLTASLSALRGNRNIGVYSLTKAAIVQLARDMAVRWGPDGVRVNAIAPGLIATGWEGAVLSDPQSAARRMQMTPLRRIGQPQEVADAALFLASDQASFITGQTLAVCGGTSITDGN